MSDKSICGICKCQFLPRSDGVGKCISCNQFYPDANTLEEVRNKTVANKDIMKMFTTDDIEGIVHKILNKVGINLKKCEKCGNLFHPKSPAQKYCSDCSTKKSVKEVVKEVKDAEDKKETKTEDVKETKDVSTQ